ncbi:hypothetical protein [Pseudogemmobacter faecipullorum]|uniref:Tip attachment protein J domain-containing protein n=1 Tax=Pseudogemmobacter faecipullorum TaxID=2755041 RepID=A0ABS8CQU5_9RHOB|nr:hypothetical protein [Pseudogemmobacter faecipullorum]MCB5411774.1 hypothetical protein [Pseudogemmobacter faecipullorum]
MSREPFIWIEIDVDGCSRSFGVGSCTATLAGTVDRKCFRTYETCKLRSAFQHLKTFRTLRYCQPRSNTPKGATWFPVMQGQPSEQSATVNIAGSDSDLSAFGRRATVSVTLTDFPDHDRFMDPYQAERVSGAAQLSGIGYDPRARGTHFGKLKARWPYYAGRPLRVKHGYLVDGVPTGVTTRDYIITNIDGPDDSGKVTISGSDVLDLADDKRTRVPKASSGKLLADIEANTTVLTLTPEGIGDLEYETAGRARIGSELVDYTRSGDVFTLTARGVNRTTAAAHKALSTFQRVKRYVGARADDVIADLLTEAGVAASYLPLPAWKAEVDRWLSGTRITRDITEPTGIKALMSSIVPLGFSLWWEAADKQIRLKANRPVDGDQIWDLSDRNTNLSVSIDEDDKQRAAAVLFWTVQKDPTKSATSSENYARTWAAGDPSALENWRYGSGAIKNFLCPWLENGADAVVRVAAHRLLRRFEKTPKKVTVELDAAKFAGIRLTDVIRVTSHGLQDDTGQTPAALYQVISRSEPKPGERIKIVAQSYQFDGRFGFATANDSPGYLGATQAQRDPGMFAADPTTKLMPNGDPPYEAI